MLLEGRAMEENKCTVNHEQHICKLGEDGKFEDIKQLVKDTKYICANCGRAATSEDNLCSPVDVDASRYM
jgi:hypothetical protein